MRERALRNGLQGVSVLHAALDEAIVGQARRGGLAVYAWTADTEGDIERLIALGVDGIVSNRPERVLAALGR
jgi:glycerophosphoryl diester phosphodiesterase